MSAGKPYVERLTPDVSAYIQPDGGWCLNNAGWVSDGESSLLVDTAATERRAHELREALLADGAPLPGHVVNTHHHGDHTYGNGVFTPGAVVVAHEQCRAEADAFSRAAEGFLLPFPSDADNYRVLARVQFVAFKAHQCDTDLLREAVARRLTAKEVREVLRFFGFMGDTARVLLPASQY